MHFLLFYDYVPDYLERREQFRAAHLTLAREAEARGELILAGVLTEPVDGAVFFDPRETAAVATAFATSDPYVQNGLVTKWQVRPWQTVVGAMATHPLPSG